MYGEGSVGFGLSARQKGRRPVSVRGSRKGEGR